MCPASSQVPSPSHPLTASWMELLQLAWSYREPYCWEALAEDAEGRKSPKAGPVAEPKKLITQMTFLLRNTSRGGQRVGSCLRSAKTDCVTKGSSSVSHPIALCLCTTGLWSRASTSIRRLSLGHHEGILPSIYFFKHCYNTSSLILSWL